MSYNKEKNNNTIINQNNQYTNAESSYLCKQCNNIIEVITDTKLINGHSAKCMFKDINKFNNNKSGLNFNIENNQFHDDTSKKLNYSNQNNNTQSNDNSITNLFELANFNSSIIEDKIHNSNFTINYKNTKLFLNKYFHEVSTNIKEMLNTNEEKIYFGNVVIFEDIFNKTPTFRLSFKSLKDENFQIKFKAYSNSQHPEIKKLYQQLLMIPTTQKRKVSKNSGCYTLGKTVYIKGILKDNTNNLYFTDITNIWLCESNPELFVK